MDSGHRLQTALPPGYTREYETFMFGQVQHLQLQANDWLHLYWLAKSKKKVVAQAAFHLDRNTAKTPVKAPFGSLTFSDQLGSFDLSSFILACEDKLKQNGTSRILITEPPLIYRKTGELVQAVLLSRGYSITIAEVSAVIPVDREVFENKIDKWEKRKLEQGSAKGASFKFCELSSLDDVYRFLAECRKERGHALSMTREDLKRTIDAFRKDFFLSGVFLEQQMIAASISIRVHPNILYNFYTGHLKKFDAMSPVVLLTQGLYKFCKNQSMEYLDLGTSSIDGKLNFSLLDFKLRLGARPSLKTTFEKALV